MNIDLTQEQYEVLLKTVYLGNWMANAVRIVAEGDGLVEEFQDIESYIVSFAEQFGFPGYVDYDSEDDRYYPSSVLEDDKQVVDLMDHYNNRTFWDELVERLAMRDFKRQYGDAANKMKWDERLEKMYPFAEAYENEFIENDLENLVIKE